MPFPTFDGYSNFAATTVATAPSPATTGTSLVVAAGTGVDLPTPPFDAVIWPTAAQPTGATAEICRVTAISTDTLTITRGPLTTTDPGGVNRTVVVGDQIAANITLKALTDIQNAMHQSIYLAAAVSTSTTTVISTGLSFAIGANEVFTFDAEVASTSSLTRTTGTVFALNAPVGATGAWSAQGQLQPAAAGTTAALSQGSVTTLTTGTTIGIFNATTATGLVFLQGNIVNGATAGTVTLYYGASSTAATVTCKPGSNLLAFRLA